jgi:plastocyanin
MRQGRRCLLGAAITTGALLAPLPAVGVSVEPSATVDAVNTGLYEHSWSPAAVAVAAGGSISIRNETAQSTPHGVHWVGGPATPSCSGVPLSTTVPTSGAKWSGTCTLTQSGTYTFYCTVHGAEMTETVTVTTPGAPTVTTGAASSIALTTATLNGTVNPQEKATKYHFDYGTTTSYGKSTSEESAGEVGTNVPVAIPLISLLPGTTYHYRLVATNAADTTDGTDGTFTTPGAPTASTGAASALSETEATLNATVNPDGQATTYLFEWGTSISYGQSTGEVTMAAEDHLEHADSATLTGLTAGTVYHFRVVAKNGSGTSPGVDQTFTTASPPAPEPPPKGTVPTPPPSPSVNVSPLGTGSSVPIVTPVREAPIVGAPALRAVQRGTSVKGSLEVSAAGVGGRLEVDVFAKSGSIARVKASPVLVGRFIRLAVTAGRMSFAVQLNTKARRALRHHHSLALSVKIALTPSGGPRTAVARNVVLR